MTAFLRTPFTKLAGVTEGHGWTALKEKYRLEHEALRANWLHNGYTLSPAEYVEKDNEYIRTGEWRSAILEDEEAAA